MKAPLLSLLIVSSCLSLAACGGSSGSSSGNGSTENPNQPTPDGNNNSDNTPTSYSLKASIQGLEKGAVLTITNKADGEVLTVSENGEAVLYSDLSDSFGYDFSLALTPASEKSVNIQRCVLDNEQGSLSADTSFNIHCTKQLFFIETGALITTNGTAAGTQILADKDIWFGNPNSLTAVGNLVYFVASDSTHGQELWVSDGTVAGTRIVKNIIEAGDSSPDDLTAVGDKLYFVTSDGASKHGRELWVSDGTEAGTQMVKDIRPGGPSSTPYYLTSVGDKLYFVAYDSTHGRELWVSNGTEDGTYMVKDIFEEVSASGPLNLTAVGDKLYFVAADNTHGSELWVSNGTEDGTYMVKDIVVGNEESSPSRLTAMDDKLYFTLKTGQLWVSDGTETGTQPVKYNDSSVIPNQPPITVGNKLYIFDQGWVYVVQGESAQRISMGGDFVYPSTIMPFKDTLYFLSMNQSELWTIDSTTDTSKRLQNGGMWTFYKPSALGDYLVYLRLVNGGSGFQILATAGDNQWNINLAPLVAPDYFKPIGSIQGEAVFLNRYYHNGVCNAPLYRTDSSSNADNAESIETEELGEFAASICPT